MDFSFLTWLPVQVCLRAECVCTAVHVRQVDGNIYKYVSHAFYTYISFAMLLHFLAKEDTSHAMEWPTYVMYFITFCNVLCNSVTYK